MSGQPRKRALAEELESRTRSMFEDDETATALDYVEHWQAAGNTLNELAEIIGEDAEFITRYLRKTFGDEVVKNRLKEARVRGSHRMLDTSLAIADSATPEDVNVARLRVQTRQWAAEKWNPAEFSAKLANVNITNNIGQLHLDALRAFRPAIATATALDAGSETDYTHESQEPEHLLP